MAAPTAEVTAVPAIPAELGEPEIAETLAVRIARRILVNERHEEVKAPWVHSPKPPSKELKPSSRVGKQVKVQVTESEL